MRAVDVDHVESHRAPAEPARLGCELLRKQVRRDLVEDSRDVQRYRPVAPELAGGTQLPVLPIRSAVRSVSTPRMPYTVSSAGRAKRVGRDLDPRHGSVRSPVPADGRLRLLRADRRGKRIGLGRARGAVLVENLDPRFGQEAADLGAGRGGEHLRRTRVEAQEGAAVVERHQALVERLGQASRTGTSRRSAGRPARPRRWRDRREGSGRPGHGGTAPAAPERSRRPPSGARMRAAAP